MRRGVLLLFILFCLGPISAWAADIKGAINVDNNFIVVHSQAGTHTIVYQGAHGFKWDEIETFDYEISLSSAELSECSLNVIAWGPGNGKQGFAGIFTGDKSPVYTGGSGISAVHSNITSISPASMLNQTQVHEIMNSVSEKQYNNPYVVPDNWVLSGGTIWGPIPYVDLDSEIETEIGEEFRWVWASSKLARKTYAVFAIPCERLVNPKSVNEPTPNRAPVARNDSLTIKHIMTAIINPIENDSDPDGDTLRITDIVDHSPTLTANIISDSEVQIGSSQFLGSQFVEYRISDEKGGSDIGRINISVVNLPELTAVNDVVNVIGSGTQIIRPLSNDVQAEPGAQIVKVFNISPHLDVQRLSNTEISIMPGIKSGTHSFEYEIGNATAQSSATVTVNVPNTPPQATNDILGLTLEPNASLIIDPLDNDTDINEDALYISSIGPVDAGLIALPDGLRRIKIQTTDVTGNLSLTYQISDGKGGVDSARVFVIVPSEPTFPWIVLIGGLGLIALLVFFILLRAFLGKALAAKDAHKKTEIAGQRNWWSPPMISTGQAALKPEKPPESGVIFPNSPLLPSAVTPGPAPLVPAGHMAPSGLQTLTGQYAVLKPAYLATGRIGGPQEGVPTNDDVSFGTGFLITPNHIMTNRHVYEFYKHYLTGPECGGIEFIAERDRDASDYVAFDGEPPILIAGLDIAIFKLSRLVTDRAPINRVSIPTQELDARDMVSISYPCPFEVDDVILSMVEDDPIFAVKRLSQGKIFRHSTDTDTPYGVQVSVDPQISTSKKLSAICHNASTLGGSSGAPILDLKGNLVGVHFAGDRAFNGEEAANLAMAIEILVRVEPGRSKKEKTA